MSSVARSCRSSANLEADAFKASDSKSEAPISCKREGEEGYLIALARQAVSGLSSSCRRRSVSDRCPL